MVYSTPDNLKPMLTEQTLIELATDTSPYTDFGDDACQFNLKQAIEQADREIDAYLVRRMPVPLSEPIPGLIVRLSSVIAIHKLHLRRHIQSETWEREYERCLQILQKIYSGEMGLGVENADSEQKSESGLMIKTSSRTRKFTSQVWDTF